MVTYLTLAVYFLTLTIDSTSPTLAINTVEFPDENILPIGCNVTVVCTSNVSKEIFGRVCNGQPYWIQFFYNDQDFSIKECGGGDDCVDSEDSKVCTFSIKNATKSHSGRYTCWAHNEMTCTEGTISLEFKGIMLELY